MDEAMKDFIDKLIYNEPFNYVIRTNFIVNQEVIKNLGEKELNNPEVSTYLITRCIVQLEDIITMELDPDVHFTIPKPNLKQLDDILEKINPEYIDQNVLIKFVKLILVKFRKTSFVICPTIRIALEYMNCYNRHAVYFMSSLDKNVCNEVIDNVLQDCDGWMFDTMLRNFPSLDVNRLINGKSLLHIMMENKYSNIVNLIQLLVDNKFNFYYYEPDINKIYRIVSQSMTLKKEILYQYTENWNNMSKSWYNIVADIIQMYTDHTVPIDVVKIIGTYVNTICNKCKVIKTFLENCCCGDKQTIKLPSIIVKKGTNSKVVFI